tara:strand:+ start:162 stop:383 length:222 start_codon:yes stop_codon:yes gene_type:complete
MNFFFSWILRLIIIIYQKIFSPLFMARCRYFPSCSEYGLEAVEKHGAWRGFCLIFKRVFSCHPWGGSGHDPVP